MLQRLTSKRQMFYSSRVARQSEVESRDLTEFRLGVLFENSIVCYVFYAILAFWVAALGCVVVWGVVLFWFAWPLFWGWVGLGLVFWTVVLICGGSWLAVFVVGWGFLFVGFVWRV